MCDKKEGLVDCVSVCTGGIRSATDFCILSHLFCLLAKDC